MSRKTVTIAIKTPDRIRWGMLYYVQTAIIKDQKSMKQAILDYADLHNIDKDYQVLENDYYRLLETHKICIQNGV